MILSHILNVNLVKRLIRKKCLSIALTFAQHGEVPRKAVGRVPYVVGYTVLPAVRKTAQL